MMYCVYVQMLDHSHPKARSEGAVGCRRWIHLLSGPGVTCDRSVVTSSACWMVLLMMVGSIWMII